MEVVGLNGAGIAFFGSYVFSGLLVYRVALQMSGFRWAAVNLKTASACFALVAAVLIGFHVLPPTAVISFGILAAILSTYVSVRILVRLVLLQRPIARFLQLGSLTR